MDEEEIIEEDKDGSIHSIHVRNFFCHDNLEINLNRNVNFIIGRNGSGKSAILTALVVGLGGRASATNRGNNLHSFIKKGANSATVEIKIKNNSPRAYKHNEYGDYITIVRTINASGGGGYKVKSASGEIVSTKFEEVNSIILAHDIQVDNPISVLNQDDARSFHASDAKKKYSLFRKATNLDQTETNYMWALENCNKAHNIWNRKNEACQELEKEYKKWRLSYEQLQSRDEIEAKKQALQNEYYWSEIADYEREAEQVQAQYDKQKLKIEKLTEKLAKMADNFGNNKGLIETLKSQLDEKNLEKAALEQELRDLEAEVRDTQTAHRSARAQVTKQGDLLARETRKVNDLEREIHNIDSGDAASRRAELERRARAAAAAGEAARARYGTAQHGAAQARAAAARARALADDAELRARSQRGELQKLKRLLQDLESQSNDSLAVYGSKMVELCDRVRKAVARNQFSAPPKGPIGAYIKVKQKEWGGALEHIIGGGITSFCVNSAEDSRKLFEIMGQVYGKDPKPAVTCSKFLARPHDVSRHEVRAGGFGSALAALHAADPAVANYLIDSVGVERILLVHDEKDAMRLSNPIENVPRNCSKIVTRDNKEYYPAPNYRSYGGSAKPCRYLMASTAERKLQLKAEIQEAEATLRSLEAKAEELESEARTARDDERAASQALQALVASRHDAEEAERAAAEALDQHQAPHHAVLVDELNITKEKLETLSNQMETLKAKEQELRNKIDQSDVAVRDVKKRLASVTTAGRALVEEIEQEKLKIEQGATERQNLSRKLKEEESKLSQVDVILEGKRANIHKLTQEALKLCPRVENARDRAIVTQELKKTQLKLSSIRDDGLSKAEVGERLLDVEKRYRRATHTLNRLKRLIDEVKSTTEKHLKICQIVQTHIIRRVKFCFQSMLSLRNYSGSMEIDITKGTLEIKCTGRDSGEKRHASTTSSLSGGERSYSTVAFIMALWECIELPFYFMDEFDVFMDNVNRKIVMELLIDHALKNTSRQFVFLTPQDASSVTAGPQISIHRMADPRP
ncbi:structural maintenance of chromosomes protein 6 [Amyelois transitella]|uniref:structural maintenance of chromosomes protein 6 n=1 Tax=Amyelois transitella TaxID=680683 RepID=UPI00299051E2|nr:structural maintenance of chromosomes protein 6 [Amyelois transitella]